jgi:hypothetical protein
MPRIGFSALAGLFLLVAKICAGASFGQDFPPQIPLKFSKREAEAIELWASNLEAILLTPVEWNDGNPGAILQLKMAHSLSTERVTRLKRTSCTSTSAWAPFVRFNPFWQLSPAGMGSLAFLVWSPSIVPKRVLSHTRQSTQTDNRCCQETSSTLRVFLGTHSGTTERPPRLLHASQLMVRVFTNYCPEFPFARRPVASHVTEGCGFPFACAPPSAEHSPIHAIHHHHFLHKLVHKVRQCRTHNRCQPQRRKLICIYLLRLYGFP